LSRICSKCILYSFFCLLLVAVLADSYGMYVLQRTHRNTLQHTANEHTADEHTATHCKKLRRTATHWTHFNVWQRYASLCVSMCLDVSQYWRETTVHMCFSGSWAALAAVRALSWISYWWWSSWAPHTEDGWVALVSGCIYICILTHACTHIFLNICMFVCVWHVSWILCWWLRVLCWWLSSWALHTKDGWTALVREYIHIYINIYINIYIYIYVYIYTHVSMYVYIYEFICLFVCDIYYVYVCMDFVLMIEFVGAAHPGWMGGLGEWIHAYIYIYICIYIRVCMYIYIHIHIYIYTYQYIYTYIYIYPYMHAYMDYVYMYTFLANHEVFWRCTLRIDVWLLSANTL